MLIESDNTATVSYMSLNTGPGEWSLRPSTMRLTCCSRDLIPRSIMVKAIHRPGVNNEFAYLLSCPDPTEWHLLERVVLKLLQLWSTPQVDLLASHLNHHCSLWFCQTGHPLAVASDALSHRWTGLSLYAFPPIPLLERTLVKIMEDLVEEVIVIATSWPRRSWYHLLLQMACEIPLLLPCRMDLLSQCLPDKGTLLHTDLKTLRLTAWKLSGTPSRIKAFQSPLSR